MFVNNLKTDSNDSDSISSGRKPETEKGLYKTLLIQALYLFLTLNILIFNKLHYDIVELNIDLLNKLRISFGAHSVDIQQQYSNDRVSDLAFD